MFILNMEINHSYLKCCVLMVIVIPNFGAQATRTVAHMSLVRESENPNDYEVPVSTKQLKSYVSALKHLPENVYDDATVIASVDDDLLQAEQTEFSYERRVPVYQIMNREEVKTFNYVF